MISVGICEKVVSDSSEESVDSFSSGNALEISVLKDHKPVLSLTLMLKHELSSLP